MTEAIEGDLRVWWIPQIPMKAFYRAVKNEAEAQLLLETLADYDLFQYENKVKPDYANAGGLQMFEDGEWSDWHDPSTGDDFDEWMSSH